MNDSEVKKKLMDSARTLGICKEGYADMRGFDRDALIDYYLKTIDWSLERGFPSLDLLEKEFSDCASRGVHIRENYSEPFKVSSLLVNVFHKCEGTIDVGMDIDNAIIPMLYFANGCDIALTSTQKLTIRPKVPVYIFGNDSRIEIDRNCGVEFVVYNCKLISHD